MRTTAHEFRHALRSLVRSKRISMAAIALFAVTIGSTTAIYAVVEAVMLRPIGMRAPDRTVVIWQRDNARSTPVVEAAYGEVDTWRRDARSVEALGVFSSVNWSLSLVDGDSRTRFAYVAVSPSFFEVVGIPPAMGRPLNSQDEAGNAPRAAVISDQLWRQHFGASPRIIGAIIRVQDDVESPVRPIKVVGVMPPGFDFPRVRSSGSSGAESPRVRAAGRPGRRRVLGEPPSVLRCRSVSPERDRGPSG